ncbi:MAG: DUF5678 domain-containing protein [Elusimicrobia bacterium]|nr:DUF5678 domain-containing protein [Elusimicrobiota bacterium]
MAAIDLTFFKSYIGKWVALSRDEKEVVAFGDTLKEAVKKVQEKKYKDPIYTKVAPLESFVPFHR